MIVKSPLELHTIVVKILVAAGTAPKNASRVADALVASNLCGVDTHGVFHLLSYIEQIKDGLLDAIASPKILKESATTALIDGNWTFGHVVAKYSMEIAIEKACGQGISVVSFVRSNHIGRLGEYAEMAADAGMISQIWASGYGVASAHFKNLALLQTQFMQNQSSSTLIAGLLMAGIFLSGFGITPVSASLDATDIPEFPAFGDCLESVSYTHLTLPTSDLV